MKKAAFLLVILICYFIFGGFAPIYSPIENFEVYKYDGVVPHFFCHQLVAEPSKAYNINNKSRFHFYKDCPTATEFYNFLCELNKKNYVLVDFYDVYGYDENGAYEKEIYVPLGKKPFLLSLDDMSFDTIGTGLSDKIVLTANGEIASQRSGMIEYDKESIPILEKFIEKHPHFSYNNARMIICPTGYNGILGYRITSKNEEVKKAEIEEITSLINKLKKLNYHFASHTYNHINCAYSPMNILKTDLQKYEKEIMSVIGKTDILSFPGGSYNLKPERIKLLNEFGYKYFLCVGMSKQYLINDKNIFIRRFCLDSSTFSRYCKIFQKYIDITKVKDVARNNF